jgi:DNA-binding NarL/FixJ family response regulator
VESTTEPLVIWVGPETDEDCKPIAQALREFGLEVAMSSNVDGLPDLLRKSRRAVVVACNCSGDRFAGKVLAALESVYHPVPVIVLADQSAFGDYYDLMSRGATHYFQLSEGPEPIARAVRLTANAFDA